MTQRAKPFEGVFTALVTPMRGGKVDDKALAELVEEQVAHGIHGLVAVGTTGESPTLSFEEHVHVVAQVVKQARNRVPVIAGTGSNSTAEAIELSKAAREVGADGLLLVTPYYNKPTQDGLVRHFRAVCEAVPLPAIVYNIPGRTGCDMLAETVARLAAEVPTVVGIKEASGSIQRATQILRLVGDRLAVLAGDDALAFPTHAVGGRGVIAVVSHLHPRAMVEMWEAAKSLDLARARELHFKIQPLVELLFVEANPIPVKSALAMMGKIADEIRPPLYPLAGEARERLRKQLVAEGLL